MLTAGITRRLGVPRRILTVTTAAPGGRSIRTGSFKSRPWTPRPCDQIFRCDPHFDRFPYLIRPMVHGVDHRLFNRGVGTIPETIRFGDYYGTGSNHQFIDNTFVKAGDHPLYYALHFDGSGASKNHIVRDATFEGGASINDVKWRNSTSDDDFTVQWTLTVETLPSAAVTIDDDNGLNVFSGVADSEGRVDVVLSQYRAEYGGNVDYSPHTVMASNATWSESVVVMVDSKQSISLVPLADFDENARVDGRDFLIWQRGLGTTGATLADGDADNDTNVDQSDLVAWQRSYGANSAVLSASATGEPPVAAIVFAGSDQQESHAPSPVLTAGLLGWPTPPEEKAPDRTSEVQTREAAFGDLDWDLSSRVASSLEGEVNADGGEGYGQLATVRPAAGHSNGGFPELVDELIRSEL